MVLLLLSSSLHAQSPGGIGQPSLWLQGNFFSESAPARTVNFNPATTIEGVGRQITISPNIEDLRRATIFTVYQGTGPDQEKTVWQMNGVFGDLLLSTRQVSSKSGKMTMVFAKKESATSEAKNPQTFLSTYLRRQPKSTVPENKWDKKNVIQFGGAASANVAGQSSGLAAEFIVYETVLKEKEIAKVETYLAIKYGITLQRNYVNSLGEMIWNRESDPLYSNNIAGIGRDDHATLYQKQSASGSSSDGLTIGIDNIAPTNASNTGQLNDRDYLLWGDNARPFTLNRDANAGKTDLLLTERKWLVKSSGRTAGTISTELNIDTKTLLPAFYPKENFYLVIDHSGYGDFAPKNCTYRTPDSLSADGIASFRNVRWETNRSGKIVFSFGLRTSLLADVPATTDAASLLSFHVYPNPIADGNYKIAVRLDKPAEITIRVYDANLHLIESRKATGQADYLLTGKITAAAGAYLVRLFASGKEFNKIIIRQ